MDEACTRTFLSRRRFAAMAAGVLAAPAIIRPAQATGSLIASSGPRKLNLENTHTGEMLDITYFNDGLYDLDALTEIDHFMRDWRNDKIMRTDPKLLDLVVGIRNALETTTPIRVLCGYRSPETNEMLRKRSRRVAKNSLHMRGMAVDFYSPDRSIKKIRNAARAFKAGGVGYYPRSGFVHVDTGDVRYWTA